MKNIFNENNTIENLIENTLKNLHYLVDTNTVVGDAFFSPDGTVIIPISKVSVGYVVGGGEYADVSIRKKISNYPLAGASGGGMSITPVGFLVQNKSGVNYIDIEDKNTYQTILNMVNKIINAMGGDKKNEKQ